MYVLNVFLQREAKTLPVFLLCVSKIPLTSENGKQFATYCIFSFEIESILSFNNLNLNILTLISLKFYQVFVSFPKFQIFASTYFKKI